MGRHLRGLISPDLQHTSITAGAAAKEAEVKKLDHYSHLINRFHFVPFAVETLGPFGADAISLTRNIGKKISDLTGDHRATSFLFQRLSVAIQRGNAIAILGTVPQSRPLIELDSLV